MRLVYSLPSPFARKIRVVLIEKGLAEGCEMIMSNPWESEEALLRRNPLSKVPALEADDGTTFFDSPLIADYLDSVGTGPRLIPADGPARWRVLRIQAMADGLMDAGVSRLADQRRPAELRSDAWQARQKAVMGRAIDALEEMAPEMAPEMPPEPGAPLDMGIITIVCALDWVEFRYGGEPWRPGHPRLAALHAAHAARPSFAETMPMEPQ